jgi:hypothetical protein
MRHWLRLFASFTLALSAAPAVCVAAPVEIRSILVEGDTIAGVGNVTTIDNVAVNSGGDWIVECDTDFANTDQDQLLVKNGAIFLREDGALADPAGSRIDSFDSVNLNDLSHSGWNFFLAGTSGIFDDSGIFYDDLLVIQESDTSTASGFSPGTPYIGFFDARINNANQIVTVASVDDPAVPTTVDRAIVVLDLDPSGALLAETVLMKEADFPPGETDSVTDFGTGPHESAFNDAGDVLFFADLTGATTTDGSIYLNTTLVAQEGSASPVEGRLYETLSGRAMDLNENGDYVFKANIDGATTDDEMIVKSGVEFVREGDEHPAVSPFQMTAFGLTSGPVQIDDNGQVLWFGDWNDPDLNIDTGLFLDAELLVQEGVTMIDSVVVDEIANGQDAFMISDDGQWVIFEATLVGGISGAFLIELPSATAVDEPAASASGEFALRVAGPNPSRVADGTRIAFDVPRSGASVSIRLFDASGRAVATIADGPIAGGSHTALWRPAAGDGLASGVYFLRMEADGFRASERIVLLK